MTILRDNRGQASVELAILMPIVLILAVVAINVLMYLGVCASFDRLFPQCVRVVAGAADYGRTAHESALQIQQDLSGSFSEENVAVEVSVADDGWGNKVFSACLSFEPHLFGLHFRSLLFGMDAPTLEHRVQFAVDSYKPGVLF